MTEVEFRQARYDEGLTVYRDGFHSHLLADALTTECGEIAGLGGFSWGDPQSTTPADACAECFKLGFFASRG